MIIRRVVSKNEIYGLKPPNRPVNEEQCTSVSTFDVTNDVTGMKDVTKWVALVFWGSDNDAASME